jgi:hypothetical protein
LVKKRNNRTIEQSDGGSILVKKETIEQSNSRTIGGGGLSC